MKEKEKDRYTVERVCVGNCLYVDSDGVLQIKVDNDSIKCTSAGLTAYGGPYAKGGKFGSSVPGTITVGGPGELHAEITETVVSDDPLKRNMVFFVQYAWGGFGSQPTPSKRVVDIDAQYKKGPDWYTPYDTVFEYDGSTTPNQNNGAGAWGEVFYLPYGQEMELGIRYRVGNTQDPGIVFGPDAFYTCIVTWIGVASDT